MIIGNAEGSRITTTNIQVNFMKLNLQICQDKLYDCIILFIYQGIFFVNA